MHSSKSAIVVRTADVLPRSLRAVNEIYFREGNAKHRRLTCDGLHCLATSPCKCLRRDRLPRRLAHVRIARPRWHELPALSRAHAVAETQPNLGHRRVWCPRRMLGGDL